MIFILKTIWLWLLKFKLSTSFKGQTVPFLGSCASKTRLMTWPKRKNGGILREPEVRGKVMHGSAAPFLGLLSSLKLFLRLDFMSRHLQITPAPRFTLVGPPRLPQIPILLLAKSMAAVFLFGQNVWPTQKVQTVQMSDQQIEWQWCGRCLNWRLFFSIHVHYFFGSKVISGLISFYLQMQTNFRFLYWCKDFYMVSGKIKCTPLCWRAHIQLV